MILSNIIEGKRKAIEEAKARKPQDALIKEARKAPGPGRFAKEISKEHRINLIAEMKKASPSRGILRKDFDPSKIAAAYKIGGVSALSVLTEEKFFLGHLEHIGKAKEAADLPVLRKDFIIDPYQIYESSFYKADAVLLIAGILTREELADFLALSRDLGMDALVEVHNEEELERALDIGAGVIGINNRDLHTFKADLGVTERLMKSMPKEKTVVSESGIKSHEDIMFLKSIGVNAFLVGEAFMVAADIVAKAKELLAGQPA